MYIPTTPNKYGIKMQCIANSCTFYLSDTFIYYGKETKLNGSEHLSVPTRTALTLMRTISGSGRNIMADNYYSSVQLADDCKEIHVEILDSILPKKKLARKGDHSLALKVIN